jgi:hypothetical protein
MGGVSIARVGDYKGKARRKEKFIAPTKRTGRKTGAPQNPLGMTEIGNGEERRVEFVPRSLHSAARRANRRRDRKGRAAPVGMTKAN